MKEYWLENEIGNRIMLTRKEYLRFFAAYYPFDRDGKTFYEERDGEIVRFIVSLK